MKKNNLVSMNYCNDYNLVMRIQESCAGVIVFLETEPHIETYKHDTGYKLPTESTCACCGRHIIAFCAVCEKDD